MKNKKQLIIVSLIAIGIVILTVAATYAFLSYRKEGQTENTIRIGNISFHYKEVDGIGHGISITDALPVSSNEDAKTLESPFNFTITSNTGGATEIPYVVTARMNNGSDLVMGDIVDLYLTEVNNNIESPTELFTNNLPKYNELEQYDQVAGYTEKVIYEGTAEGNYEKNFKLRMWIDQYANYAEKCSVSTALTQADCTTAGGTWGYQYNNKTFSVTVNVYANGKVLTEEEYALKKSANITSISVGNETPTLNSETGVYELTTTNSEVEINLTTENPNASVQVVPTDSTYAYNMNTGIRRITAANVFDLSVGDNYFKIIVTPVDKEADPKTYKLKIHKNPSTDATLSSISISNCPLNETFDSETIAYTCTTRDAALNMNYTKSNSHSNVVVTGDNSILVGANTVTLAVTAEDGTTTKTYTITATRDELLSFTSENEVGDMVDINYSGTIKEVDFNLNGKYKVEVWGAQGANATSTKPGGYGGYSVGVINITETTTLYVGVGGQGNSYTGGYNGGGNGGAQQQWGTAGGGATHIATTTGLLSALESLKGTYNSTDGVYESNDILIVAAGGGGRGGVGGNFSYGAGGNAGGYAGNNGVDPHNSAAIYYGTGANQSRGGSSNSPTSCAVGTFGQGSAYCVEFGGSGGGGGFFGGGGSHRGYAGGGGGSSYIGSPNLISTNDVMKSMYCLNCSQSTNEKTYTVNTSPSGSNSLRDLTNCPNGYSENPIAKCAKEGNGYARITYLGV